MTNRPCGVKTYGILFSLIGTSLWAESVKYTVSKHLWSPLFTQIILWNLRLYTVKYIFKGALKANLWLTDVSDKDELTLYIRGRYGRGARHRNEDLDTSTTCFIIVIQYINKPIFIWKRDPSKWSITRMEMLYITAGEIWYLWLLLLNCACVSFVDLRTVNWITHRTFQEATI